MCGAAQPTPGRRPHAMAHPLACHPHRLGRCRRTLSTPVPPEVPNERGHADAESRKALVVVDVQNDFAKVAHWRSTAAPLSPSRSPTPSASTGPREPTPSSSPPRTGIKIRVSTGRPVTTPRTLSTPGRSTAAPRPPVRSSTTTSTSPSMNSSSRGARRRATPGLTAARQQTNRSCSAPG